MNVQINKVANDIEKTKAKIAELQALLPELEKKKTDLENAEIVRLVRKASVEPNALAGFLNSIKTKPSAPESTAQGLINSAQPNDGVSAENSVITADNDKPDFSRNTTHENPENTAKD